MSNLYTLNHDLNVYKRDLENLEAEAKEKEKEIENFDPSQYIDEDQYSDMLDDVYGEIEIAGYTWNTSIALYRIDPIAYKCGFSDYVSNIDLEDIPEYNDLVEELENLEDEINECISNIEILEEESEELEQQLKEEEEEDL